MKTTVAKVNMESTNEDLSYWDAGVHQSSQLFVVFRGRSDRFLPHSEVK